MLYCVWCEMEMGESVFGYLVVLVVTTSPDKIPLDHSQDWGHVTQS